VDSEGRIYLFIFGFMNIYIYTDSNSQISLFNNFVDVLVDLNNLRHQHYLLYNFLKQIGNLNNLLLSCEDRHNFLLNCWHGLKPSLNNVSHIFFSNKSLCFNYLIFVNNYLFYYSIFTFDCNHFFFNSWDFNNRLMDNRNLNWSISELFNDVAYFNYDWDLSWKLDDVRYLHYFFIKSFDFIYFGYFSINNNQFFNNSRNFNYSVTILNYWLSNSRLNFLHDFTDVGSKLFNLSKDVSNNRFLNCTIDLFNLHFFNFNLHDCLNLLDDLNNLLDVSVDRDDLLDDTVYRYWNFHRDD
jgi:hypothetical protein